MSDRKRVMLLIAMSSLLLSLPACASGPRITRSTVEVGQYSARTKDAELKTIDWEPPAGWRSIGELEGEGDPPYLLEQAALRGADLVEARFLTQVEERGGSRTRRTQFWATLWRDETGGTSSRAD